MAEAGRAATRPEQITAHSVAEAVGQACWRGWRSHSGLRLAWCRLSWHSASARPSSPPRQARLCRAAAAASSGQCCREGAGAGSPASGRSTTPARPAASCAARARRCLLRGDRRLVAASRPPNPSATERPAPLAGRAGSLSSRRVRRPHERVRSLGKSAMTRPMHGERAA